MEVKALSVSQSGDIIVAGGLDEGFRVWKQTNEQTIASDME
jgi:WD40 repeat protein